MPRPRTLNPSAFGREVIPKLESDFELPGTEVDEWIDAVEQTAD
jgi:hypothetical protein